MRAVQSLPLTEIQLQLPSGQPTQLAELGDRFLVVQMVRYFGCLPCQKYLQELDARAPEFAERGAEVVAIAGSAAYQAQWLAKNGVSIPLLLDPDQSFRQAVEFGKLRPWMLLSPKGAARYLQSFGRGRRLMKITADTIQTPGVLIIDQNKQLAWSSEGSYLGDYPAVQTVLNELDRLVANAAVNSAAFTPAG